MTDRVIVVLRNQVAALPDTRLDATRRASAVHASQAAVLAQLRETHATGVKSLTLINAVTATVSPGEAAELKANPAVQEVVKDEPIPLVASPQTAPAVTADSGFKPLPGACSSGNGVQLDPQAIETIHAASQTGKGDVAQALGYTGAGVKVAFIADGLNINDPDFIRADGKKVFVDYQDFSGTGTNAPTDGGEAFLDASSIAAQGREVYNLQNFGTGLDRKCLIRIRGVAPGASLVGLNVFGAANIAFNSVFLEAINYAVNHDHVNVINESFGGNPFPDAGSLDLTRMADDAAVAAGVTVTVSTGDAGVTNTIGSPATDPAVISAGASTTYRAYAQSGISGIATPGITGWLDNNISGLSSAGFSQAGNTQDVVAPGDLNWALCSPHPALYAACTGFTSKPSSVELSGGTSEAAPLTAGTAALVIQAYRAHHHGATPSPAVVKQIIVSTAQNIGLPANQGGAGLVDAYKAVLAAISYKGTSSPGTGAVLDSSTQFNAVAAPGTEQIFNETLTNDGNSTRTVTLGSRTLGAYTSVLTKTLNLQSTTGYVSEVQFKVPSGEARLDASVAMQGGVLLALVSPAGKYAESNDPQGVANFGDSEVTNPAAGTWAALIQNFSATASSVTAQFQASVAKWTTFGSLSATSLTIPAGGSQSFTFSAPTPADPGDQAGSITLSAAGGPSFAQLTSIPVTLRSLAPAPSSATSTVSFSGTLTGGNGRSSATGQTLYYEMDVPSGLPALTASVSTDNANNTFFAELVSPSGQAMSTAGNQLVKTDSSGNAVGINQDGTELHVLNPVAGEWTLVVVFFNTVSGAATSTPVDVTMSGAPATASAVNLPSASSTQITPGKPYSAEVQVTNTGTAPEAYFVDARTTTSANISLGALTKADLRLPDLAGTVPAYLVPTHTTALSAKVTTSRGVFFDLASVLGDPDVISSTPLSAHTATASFTQAPIASGPWSVTPFLTGPTGSKAFKGVEADTSLTATTLGFDSSVTAGSGDLWLTGVGMARGFTPYVVQPGQTATIPVTITPSAATGTVVSGTLYLDDVSLLSNDAIAGEIPGLVPEASDIAAFPYTYTVGTAPTTPPSP